METMVWRRRFDNDGFDDLYVCQPAGLPNRLYRNRGDGTFEDVTEQSGVDVLDNTACALFADFENKGLQDLLVVCGSGPLLFLNQGNGKFLLKRDAFKFAHPPQGTFTHAAIADYDRDGRLDIYFCLYSYYLGLDQYHYPVPYFDARNGPPNFLFHNQGNATFDRPHGSGRFKRGQRPLQFLRAHGATPTATALPISMSPMISGEAISIAINGDGTFSSVSTEAGVEDPRCRDELHPGSIPIMTAIRIFMSPICGPPRGSASPNKKSSMKKIPRIFVLFTASTHAAIRSIATRGNGTFQNVSRQAGVEMGRWAWSSDAWDFDHDGYSDLYVANGYISGAGSSRPFQFFLAAGGGEIAAEFHPSPNYERGWNAINELIRSDSSWSGRERNVFYANNGDGTFSEVSGTVGLDFPDDSRAFALADLDHDGRLEVVLKNRNAPQLRILHNVDDRILGSSVAFRLRGNKSNRDAIGTAITVEVNRPARNASPDQISSGWLGISFST